MPEMPVATPQPTHSFDLYRLGMRAYQPVWQTMRQYTDQRQRNDRDQLWLVEHLPVFTQGQAGKPEHVLMPGDIPVVQSDRGGQVTYHGPGQLIAYLMFDLKRCGIGVRAMVTALEQSVIEALAQHGIEAFARPDAPGVYVDRADGSLAKIASLGLRVRRGCSYHGIAFNLDMDLSPFERINPCGYAGMAMTQLRDLLPAGKVIDRAQEADRWLKCLVHQLTQQSTAFLFAPIAQEGDPFEFYESGGES
ncbi:lipoyl(octanoyl) transferase LipB [Zymobacter sp. IVIA_12111.31 C1]|uniref:lipoyl(octanoyl) transferase LipB n=1 Tax=Zymobacter sp. IVIA_12111.31 C1 TaxID=3394854 RepID=UPI0039C1E11B